MPVKDVKHRITLSEEELLKRCRDAARMALRSELWSADDKEECTAHLVLTVLEAMALNGQGARRASDGTTLVAGELPRRNDPRWSFTALKRAAGDWRDATDRQRDRDALLGGDETVTVHVDRDESELCPLDRWTLQPVSADGYRAADENQGMARIRTAVSAACAELGFPAGTDENPSPAYCLMYEWIAERSAEESASDLGVSWSAWRKRTSRARKSILETYPDASDLIAVLAGVPVRATRDLTFFHGKRTAMGPAYKVPPILTGQLMFSTTDASREIAHTDGLKGTLALDWRDGTLVGRDADGIDLTGQWPTRPVSIADARNRCRVMVGRAIGTRTAERNRVRAARERTALENRRWGIDVKRASDPRLQVGHEHPAPMPADLQTSQALARASMAQRAGRPDKRDNGQTTGTAKGKYASRAVRLGLNAGLG